MPETGSVTGLKMASGLSGNADPVRAAEQVCAQAARELRWTAKGGGPSGADLALLFVSSHHAPDMARIGEVVRRTIGPGCLLGVSAESVLGGETELEQTPGVALLLARMPGVELVPFTAEHMLPIDDSSESGSAPISRAIGAADDLRASIFFVDPFSVPLVKLLPALNRARAKGPDGAPVGKIIGGLASGGAGAGSSALLLDDKVSQTGLVGVSLRGPVRVDCVVSQGCRPFGPTMIVTKAKGNLVMQLGGRPAIEAVREALEPLSEEDRDLVQRKGLLIGRVINEYKERFGRSDFLIRNVVGIEEKTGSIAVTDLFRVGQTVQLHLRDAKTAGEDLALLLDAQKLYETPAGGLLITCNGRGSRLFDAPGHDTAAVTRAFAPELGGEEKAKSGKLIEPPAPGDGAMPLAGFFAAGEIGPVGSDSYLHGHTACLALFRAQQNPER